jgi:hypothetical protein
MRPPTEQGYKTLHHFTRMKNLFVLLLVLLCASCSTKDQHQRQPIVLGAKVTEVGIYTARVIKTFDVPGVVGGTNQGLDSFTLVQATTIPARIGTRFGFRYAIHGRPLNAPIVLKMVGKHPPFTDPKTGKTQTTEEYELESWIGQTYTSYLFEEEWELIPGKFKFEVWHEGKKLCEQSFTAVSDTKPYLVRALHYEENCHCSVALAVKHASDWMHLAEVADPHYRLLLSLSRIPDGRFFQSRHHFD